MSGKTKDTVRIYGWEFFQESTVVGSSKVTSCGFWEHKGTVSKELPENPAPSCCRCVRRWVCDWSGSGGGKSGSFGLDRKSLPIAKFIRSLPKNFANKLGLFVTKSRVLVRIHTKKFIQSSPKAWEDKFLGIHFLAPTFGLDCALSGGSSGFVSEESSFRGILFGGILGGKLWLIKIHHIENISKFVGTLICSSARLVFDDVPVTCSLTFPMSLIQREQAT